MDEERIRQLEKRVEKLEELVQEQVRYTTSFLSSANLALLSAVLDLAQERGVSRHDATKTILDKQKFFELQAAIREETKSPAQAAHFFAVSVDEVASVPEECPDLFGNEG
jgi:hypothetical protein